MNAAARAWNGFAEIMRFDNRAELLVRRLFFRGSSLVTYRYRNLRLLIDHAGGDVNGIRPCLLGDMYRAYLRALDLPQGREINVLDVGANAGGFSLMLAVDGCRFKKLVAVEMNPMTAARLRLNLSYNIFPPPVVINGAASAEPGVARLPFSLGSTADTLSAESAGATKAFTVDCLTLDSLIEAQFGDEEIDLCKIDIEGSEYDIFAADTCRRLSQCRCLLIEIHRCAGRDREAVKQAIGRLGFSPVTVKDAPEPDVYCFRRGSGDG